jgi:hypothetical protein
MQTACRELRVALLQDLALGRKVLENANSIRMALIANDHVLVSEIEAAGRQIVAQQEANSFRRDTAILALAEACCVDCGEGEALPRLTDLARMVPAAESKMLLALREAILESEGAVREVAEKNRRLVQNGLDVVNFTFQSIADLATRPAGYGATTRPPAPTFYLDHQA